MQYTLLFAALLSLQVSYTTAQVCTADDVRSMFTPCNDATHEMQSVQYFSKQCDNSQEGAIKLRAPSPTPCVKSCPSGTFYSPASLACDKCPKGQFSNSGGQIINTFGTELPARFSSYCSPSPCSPWRVADGLTYLDSANQSVGIRHGTWYNGVDESVEVTLNTIINVINPRGGKLFFQYRVESEKNFDGLQLFLNGSLIKNPEPLIGNDRFFATGLHHLWRDAAIPLPVGRTDVRFVYSKDANQLSDAANYAGEDRAFLKDFTIEGVQMFAPSCTLCAPGEYADSVGSMSCQTCPANTYSNSGAEGCLRCADEQWSPVGSSKCFPKAICNKEDYVAVYEACTVSPSSPNEFSRFRDWKLVNQRCSERSTSKPAADSVPCAICPTGFHMNDALVCVPCPTGQMYDASSKQCTACPPGTAALPILDFQEGFDSFNGVIPQD